MTRTCKSHRASASGRKPSRLLTLLMKVTRRGNFNRNESIVRRGRPVSGLRDGSRSCDSRTRAGGYPFPRIGEVGLKRRSARRASVSKDRSEELRRLPAENALNASVNGGKASGSTVPEGDIVDRFLPTRGGFSARSPLRVRGENHHYDMVRVPAIVAASMWVQHRNKNQIPPSRCLISRNRNRP